MFGATVASSALSYGRIYKTAVQRQRLADAFGSNHAASALFGPAPNLQTVAGFTVFKASMTLMIIGAVWGLLISTRLLRGEEDAGRWELLLSGQTTRRHATGQALGGLGGDAALLWAITAVATLAVGRLSSVHIGAGAALYLALALVATGVMFLTVGALTSQLAPTRRQAAGYAGVILGVSYGLRMVADAGTGLHGLIWASPLGWVEELRPLTGARPWALVPIGVFTAVTALTAVHLAGVRDVGAAPWRAEARKPSRFGLLTGPTGLAVRLMRSSVAWWAIAVAVCGVLMGIVAKAAGTTIVGSSVQEVFSRLGAPGSGTRTFLGISFVILAIIVCYEAASLVSAARNEEAEGRVDHLLVGAVSRTRWLVGRLLLAVAAVLVSGVAAGLFTWVGAASQGSAFEIGHAVGAGLNIVPPGVFLLGVGALAFGRWPRRASAVVYGVLSWSALIELVGGFFAQNRWVLDTSLLHHTTAAPAVAPDWGTNAVMVVLGFAMMAAGVGAFRYRDVQGE